MDLSPAMEEEVRGGDDEVRVIEAVKSGGGGGEIGENDADEEEEEEKEEEEEEEEEEEVVVNGKLEQATVDITERNHLNNDALLALPPEPEKPFILKSGAQLGLFYLKAGVVYSPKIRLKKKKNDVGNVKLKEKLYKLIVEDQLDATKIRREVCQLVGCMPRIESEEGTEDGSGNGDDGEYDGISEVYHVSRREMDGRIRRLALSVYNAIVTSRIDEDDTVANSNDDDDDDDEGGGKKAKNASVIDVSEIISIRRTIIDALIGNVVLSRTYLTQNLEHVGNANGARFIDGIEIDRPILVLGMPRSGTTFLFNMLNVDDRLRTPRNFEGSWPICPKSMRAMQLRYMTLFSMQVLFQNMVDIHVEDLESPCEMNRLLKNCFGGIFWHLGLYMPLTADFDRWWFTNEDEMTADFTFFKRQLQIMQAMRCATEIKRKRRGGLGGIAASCFGTGNGGAHNDGNEQSASRAPRWLLKEPSLLYLGHFCATFPGATIVITHRNLKSALPSLFSLRKRVQQTGRGQFHVDASQDVQRFVDVTKKHMDVVMDFRNKAEEDPSLLHGCKIIDVSFKDLAAEPAKTVESVYNAAGLEMKTQTRANLQAYITESRKALKKNKHKYSVGDFGINDAEIDDKFQAYHDYFGLS